MAGIRVDTPKGNGWLYSLDQVTWQNSRIFATQSDGTPFVVGTTYTVYCQNNTDRLRAINSILFGQKSSSQLVPVSLDIALKNGADSEVMPAFLGGILALLPDEPTGENYPVVTVAPDGTFYKRLVSSPTVPPPAIDQIAHFELIPDEVSAPVPIDQIAHFELIPDGLTSNGIYRIVDAAGSPSIVVGESRSVQLSLQEQLSDQSWVAFADPRVWSTLNPTPGSSISSTGLLSIPANSISQNAQMGVNVTISGSGSTVQATVQVLNNSLPVVDFATQFLTASQGSAFSHPVPVPQTFSDPDGDTLTYTLEYSSDLGETYTTVLPGWCAYDGTNLSGTPPISSGNLVEYYFRVRANDNRSGITSDPFILKCFPLD